MDLMLWLLKASLLSLNVLNDVFGKYYVNSNLWDSQDEVGGGHCTADEDYKDAQREKFQGENIILFFSQVRYHYFRFVLFFHLISFVPG
jgi:hypothetical protein